MFEGMFDTAQQILTGVKQGAVLSSWDRSAKNCADLLQMPQKQRKKGYPMGLKNQGATCYLNSFLQILYHTPQLRKTILSLPLCQPNNIDKKTQFISSAKHNFLYGFQRLFSQMCIKDTYSVQTDYLNKAFGWQGKQHVQQQDMTQAMKIIFDTMQRALYNTQYESVMKSLFKGTTARYKTCRNCTISQQRQQQFYDLNVQVKNFSSLSQSLLGSLTPESMQGDNCIFCQTCQSKQDMWLGTRYKCFPNILVFTLNRFQFDYQTFNRVKLNTYFQFNLEENLGCLIDQGKEQQYQLYGVIIHRGSAHSGHYLAYIRDFICQSNWQNGIKQTNKQQEIKQNQKTPLELLSQEQKKKRIQLQKEDTIHKLKQPQNKQLLQNWYQMNDSIVTAIDAKKITSKYQGSDSAYILFYRRKNATPLQTEIKVPKYLMDKIADENNKIKQQRQKYEYEKNHIILKINGQDVKLNIKTKITQILDIYCPQGFSLVMQSTHNSLPYYPIQFVNSSQSNYTQQDTIEKYELLHESIWKTYLVFDQQYEQQIKPNIGKQKLPFQVNLKLQSSNYKILLYQDMTLANMRMKITQKYNIPYINQVIQLVTPYKQYFVTDELQNDQILLTKLGFVNQCQVIVKNVNINNININKNKNDENIQMNQLQQSQPKPESDQLCFIVQRDDQIGIKKFYFSKYQTLLQLMNFIIDMQKFDTEQKRRLRNLNGNRLYYLDHYEKQLQNLDFTQQMIKLRIQRGQIPIKGDVCVKVKLQSKYQSLQIQQNTIISKVFDPNTSILQLKIQLCKEVNLIPQMHRVYLTDWMGEPVRGITKENQSIFQAHFSRQQTICLRDVQSPIGSQLLHFELFLTYNGSADSLSKESFHVKMEMHKTILQFKQKLINQLKQNNPFGEDFILNLRQITAKKIRVRQIKRDYMFGNVWRNHDKQLKDVNVNTNKLAIQILPIEQNLKQDQIVLILKKRNIQKKLYEGCEQLIFEAGKQPKIQELTKAIKEKLNLDQQFPLIVIKYFNYNFQWVQISKQSLENMENSKKNNKNKKDNKDNNNKKNQKGGDNKKKVQNKQKNQNKQKDNTQNKQKQNKKQKKNNDKNQQQKVLKNQQKIQKQVKQQKSQQTQIQTQLQNKQKPQQKQQKPKISPQTPQTSSLDFLNLRKAPTLLKDGDWLGWGNLQQIRSFKDDLQTEQDLTLRFIKKSNKNAEINYGRKNDGGGFKINVGF